MHLPGSLSDTGCLCEKTCRGCFRWIRNFSIGKRNPPRVQNHVSNLILDTGKIDRPGRLLDQPGLFIDDGFPEVIDYKEIVKLLQQRNPRRE